jgi:hypothetical protein
MAAASLGNRRYWGGVRCNECGESYTAPEQFVTFRPGVNLMNVEMMLEHAARLAELTDRVSIGDRTTFETLTIVAVIEAADKRLNAPPAPVLRLIGAKSS